MDELTSDGTTFIEHHVPRTDFEVFAGRTVSSQRVSQSDKFMLAIILIFVLVGAWVISEISDAKVLIRLSLDAIAGLSLAIGTLAFQTALMGFDATLHANNATKNLARGLVVITSGEIDQGRLNEDLQQLDRNIVPSYEDYNSAGDAVNKFLDKYGIDYVKEMPIDRAAAQDARL
ncbi:MAG: hypothetical protein ACO1RT_05170 [Planctomycetaceae bacterium]